jgi:hypothetical protein
VDSFFYAYVIFFFGGGKFYCSLCWIFLFYVNLKCAYLCKTRLKNACPSVVLFIFIIVKLRLQQITEREYHTIRRNNIERIYSFAQKFFVTKKHIRMQKSSTF